ncbi:hypothetical protein MRX96_023649 [Rhipicephalus microplus]
MKIRTFRCHPELRRAVLEQPGTSGVVQQRRAPEKKNFAVSPLWWRSRKKKRDPAEACAGDDSQMPLGLCEDASSTEKEREDTIGAPHGAKSARHVSRGEGIGHWTVLVHVEGRVQQPRSRAHGPAAETFGEVLEAWIAGAGAQAGALAARALSRRSPKVVVTCTRSAESRDATARDAKMRSLAERALL